MRATKESLKSMTEFLESKKIGFYVTGTMALYLMKLVPDGYQPEDIDIIVPCNDGNKESLKMFFSDLDKLHGHKHNVSYENAPFYFRAGGDVFNAWVNVFIEYETKVEKSNIKYVDDNITVNLLTPMENFYKKFQIGRAKDFVFWNQLQVKIINFFNKQK